MRQIFPPISSSLRKMLTHFFMAGSIAFMLEQNFSEALEKILYCTDFKLFFSEILNRQLEVPFLPSKAPLLPEYTKNVRQTASFPLSLSKGISIMYSISTSSEPSSMLHLISALVCNSNKWKFVGGWHSTNPEKSLGAGEKPCVIDA